MHSELSSGATPPLTLVQGEADALFGLAWAARTRSQLGALLLLQELARADTCERDAVPPDVVIMRSRVSFQDEETGEEHEIQIVYPRDADIALGRVSVLSPIGAGLIGLHKGSSISWPNRLGSMRTLTVHEVVQPAEGE